MLLVTWNLFHGRSSPPAGRPLAAEFAAALAGWEWDVALLQEVPHWWPAPLAAASGAEPHRRLTSRNWAPPLQRAVSSRNPDLLKSWDGGCIAILVRGGGASDHHGRRLRLLPERRRVHGVRLADGTWVVNLHAHHKPQPRAQADCERAIAAAREWAAGAPLVFGGDVNLKRPAFDGLVHVAGNYVDHLFTDGRPAAGPGEVLDRGTLSDHAPVAVTLS